MQRSRRARNTIETTEVTSGSDVLSIEHVVKRFMGKQGGKIEAVSDVSLSLKKGETLGVVGESGSGKTTLGRIAVGLIYPTEGTIRINGKSMNKATDRERFLLAQYIHQDPYGSLDTYSTVGDIMSRPLKYLKKMDNKSEVREKVVEMLRMTGLDESFYAKTVQELSGGERQRVLIGRAFIVEPEIIVADEPTTMIDFVHRNEVIDLIFNLKKTLNISVIFITHDVALANRVSNRLIIMYKGKVVERGVSSAIQKNPQHPYTKLLMSVSPEVLLKQGNMETQFLPKGSWSTRIVTDECIYAPNCPFVMDSCRKEQPPMKGTSEHEVACFLY